MVKCNFLELAIFIIDNHCLKCSRILQNHDPGIHLFRILLVSCQTLYIFGHRYFLYYSLHFDMCNLHIMHRYTVRFFFFIDSQSENFCSRSNVKIIISKWTSKMLNTIQNKHDNFLSCLLAREILSFFNKRYRIYGLPGWLNLGMSAFSDHLVECTISHEFYYQNRLKLDLRRHISYTHV